MRTVIQASAIAIILTAVAVPRAAAEPPPPIVSTKSASPVRIVRTPVKGGGELFTFFKTVPEENGAVEVPFVSILRDTMGDADPDNDELRDVWALTQVRPSWWRRALAAVPFLYHRAGSARPAEQLPASLIDLARPAKGTIPRAMGRVAQATVFDVRGLPYRAPSRAYRARTGEYRDMHLWRTLDLLSAGDHTGDDGLTGDELNFVRGRVLLARNLFGGYVDDEYVTPGWKKFNMSTSETRGHNWELLRQRAEENGLYFQPLELARNVPSFALLWMDQSQAGTAPQKFDSKFLGISNPFTDSRIAEWKDYSETWKLDSHGSRVPDEAAAFAREARMIPLALYSLEHPRVPLLMVDLRDPGKPRRREMVRRATDDVATGVFGLTGFGNWTWFAFRTTASFVHGRRVAPLDRSARVRAFVQVRQALSTDTHLAPALRDDLIRRVDKLGLNPFDNASRAEIEIARKQHKALIESAVNGGLREHLATQRMREAEQILHSRKSRVLRRTAAIATFGIYRHREPNAPALIHVVDRQRRIAHHRRIIEQALASSPRPEITSDMNTLRRSVEELMALVEPSDTENRKVQDLVSNLFLSTWDEETRRLCHAALARLENNGRSTVAFAEESSEGVKISSGGSQ